MLLYAVDDEPLVLRSLERAVREAAPEAALRCFGRTAEILEALEREQPDAVFSDIEMPGMDGLALAAEIKKRAPDTRVIFVTGYSHYALEAFRVRASGYILKPVTAERVREELSYFSAPAPAPAEKLEVRCFGTFDVFWHGEPLHFARSQTKELFAYLVDREGAACSGGEIIAALWEDAEEMKNPRAYLRTLTSDLRSALSAVGMEAVLIRQYNLWAVRRELLDCDYYRMRRGDMAALNAYRGEYMKQYSWAELTSGRLWFSGDDAPEKAGGGPG